MSRAVVALLLLAFMVASGGRVSAQGDDPANPVPETGRTSQAILQAKDLFQQGQLGECLKVLKQAKQDDPHLPPAQFLFAKLLFAANQPGPGRASLEQAAVDEPDYPGTYVAFGLLGIKEGRLTDALLEFNKGVDLLRSNQSLDKSDANSLWQQCHLGIATVAESRYDWRLAKTELTSLLEMEPENFQGRQRLARVLFRLGAHQPAYEELKRAAATAGGKTETPEISMVRLFSGVGNHPKAEEWLNFALKQGTDDVRVRLAAAGWFLDRERTEEAAQHAEVAARLSPQENDVKMVRAMVARQRKQLAEAERLFQQVHTDSPGDFTASNLLALVLADQDDAEKHNRAQQLAEINLRQYPRSPDALATAGWVNFRLGKLDAAERLLDAAVSGGRASPETAYFLARVKAAKGQPDQAKAMLEQAVKSEGGFAYRDDARSQLNSLKAKPAAGQ